MITGMMTQASACLALPCDSAESRRAGPLARHPIMMIIGSSAAAGPRPVSRLGATVQCAVATVWPGPGLAGGPGTGHRRAALSLRLTGY